MQQALRFEASRSFDTNESLIDVAWSECNENQFLGGCGDGSVRLWDERSVEPLPIAIYKEHKIDVSSFTSHVHQPGRYSCNYTPPSMLDMRIGAYLHLLEYCLLYHGVRSVHI
jgi:hypothetical protein